MEQGALEKLKYDKRLQTRAGWLESADRDAMEEALPDVASKSAGSEPEGAGGVAPEAPATPEV